MTKWLNNNKSETKKRSCYERLKKGVTFAELIGDLHDRSSERERERDEKRGHFTKKGVYYVL